MTLTETIAGWMKEGEATVNTVGAPEKHLPTTIVLPSPDGDGLFVVEVVVPHVMDEEAPHYIEAIWLIDDATGDVVEAKLFTASDPAPPTLTAKIPSGISTVTPMLHCNLHGLWKGESLSVV